MACQICTEKYNKTTRKQISCPKCSEIFCLQCVQTYVSNGNLICMSCKTDWEYDFLLLQLSKKFINTVLKEMQQKKLFDIERSLLPETVYYVELIKKKETLIQEKRKISELIGQLHQKIFVMEDQIEFCTNEIHGQSSKKYIPKIIGGCPKEDCRGFI